MMEWDSWHAGGEWMMGIGIVAVVLLIAVGVYLVFRATSSRSGGLAGYSNGASAAPSDSALDLLDSRYARGEIEREDYLSRRQDLQGHS